MTHFLSRAITTPLTKDVVVVPSNGYILINASYETDLSGYTTFLFNFKDFNTTSYLSPIVHGIGGLIDTGVIDCEIDIDTDGTRVTSKYTIARGDSRYLSSAKLFYNDGSGLENVSMSVRTDTLEGTSGPYLKGTNITFYAVAYDMFGNVFVLPEGTFNVTTDPLPEPTTTTTTTTSPTSTTGEPTDTTTSDTNTTTPTSSSPTGPGLTLDPMLLAVAGGVGAVLVLIIVIFAKKRT